jgi:hypothetical protein
VSNAKELSSLKELLESLKKGQELEVESLVQIRGILCPSESIIQIINRE